MLPACCPDRAALCDRCIADVFAQLRGVAACRGEVWAMDLARRVPRTQPWPSGSDQVNAIARTKVADLARDPKLLERLAAELAKWAARWWMSPSVV